MALLPKFPSFSEIRSTLTNLYNRAKASIFPSSSAGGAQGDQVPFIPKEKEEATIPFKRGTFARKNSQQPQNTPPQGSSETLDTQAPSSGREAPAALRELQEVLEKETKRRSDLEKQDITTPAPSVPLSREAGSIIQRLNTEIYNEQQWTTELTAEELAKKTASSFYKKLPEKEKSMLQTEFPLLPEDLQSAIRQEEQSKSPPQLSTTPLGKLSPQSSSASPATSRSGLSSFQDIMSKAARPETKIAYQAAQQELTKSSTSSRELAQANKDLNESLSKQATPEDRSPKSSRNSSPTGITWRDGRSSHTTRGVGKELESPAFSPASPASPSSPASQARTVSAGSPPAIQFPDLNPEVTRLAEAAVRQARLSGRGAIEAEEARQRADIKADHLKQVEDMRTKIATTQPSVVESFFGGIAKNFSGIGGQTPVEPSTSASAPAPSNQAIATTDKSPKQGPKEHIPVFATPPKEDKENSGQRRTSSLGSSNTGRAPFSPNNSFNTTGSNSESASSSSETGTSSRTGTSSGTQRTSSSITSQKSVTLPGGTKVKGTSAQVEAMQEALSSGGRSPNSVADKTSAIEERTREDSAVAALEKARRELKGAPAGHLPSRVTIRERSGLRTFSGRGAVADLQGVRSFTDGNGNGGRGGSAER